MTSTMRVRPAGSIERFGTTTLLSVSWVLPADDLTRQERRDIARAATRTLSGLLSSAAAAQIRTTDVSVVVSVRVSSPALPAVADRLRPWRADTAANLADGHRSRRATPPGDLAELADRLMVSPSNENSPTVTDPVRSTAVVTGREVTLHLAGGPDLDVLAAYQDLIADALRPTVSTPAPVGPPVEELSTPGRMKLPDRVWITLPGSGSPLARLYTPVTTSDTPERRALSMANVLFGGVFDSELIRAVRRTRGLSYSCHSRIRTVESREMIVIDMRTGPGMESASIDVALDAIDRLRENGVSPSDVEAVREYLIGRALVESDILPARTRNASDGEDPQSIAEQLAHVDTTSVAEQLDQHFRSDRYRSLVVSAAARPTGWKEIGS